MWHVAAVIRGRSLIPFKNFQSSSTVLVRNSKAINNFSTKHSLSVLEELQQAFQEPLKKLFSNSSNISPMIARSSVDAGLVMTIDLLYMSLQLLTIFVLAHYQCNNAFSIARQLNINPRFEIDLESLITF